MGQAPESGRVVRFGVFEVDLAAGELRRHGLKVKLQDRPCQILGLLLRRPGQIVTREELRNTLWAADVFVDFDNSINTAVNKLREALGDSAENPRFIETVGRRSYRWIPDATRPSEPERLATGEAHAGAGLPSAAPGSAAEGASSLRLDRLRPPSQKGETESLPIRLAGRGRRVTLLVAGATFILTALLSFWVFSPTPLLRVIRSVQITQSGRVEVWGRIVTDGGRLYYLEREGPYWNLVQTSVAGGSPRRVGRHHRSRCHVASRRAEDPVHERLRFVRGWPGRRQPAQVRRDRGRRPKVAGFVA